VTRWVLITALALASGCSIGPRPGGYFEDDGPDARAGDVSRVPDATPRFESRARSGNKPYTVYGVTYTPLDSSRGYRERGIASWYGKKFHGRRTSSGESYDMYAMSAAHKTLPLPSYVRVRNLGNGKSVVVRVNDRGPFLHNRLIDLSYAAASRLGIVGSGTGLVEIEAVEPGEGAPGPTTVASAAGTVEINALPVPRSRPVVELIPAAEAAPSAPPATPEASAPSPTDKASLYLQVGAFKEWDNAVQLRTRLERAAFRPIFIQSTLTPEQQRVYRVRIGPLASVEDSDRLVQQLAGQGVANAIAVVE
jgi:rare lipoprotein A